MQVLKDEMPKSEKTQEVSWCAQSYVFQQDISLNACK